VIGRAAGRVSVRLAAVVLAMLLTAACGSTPALPPPVAQPSVAATPSAAPSPPPTLPPVQDATGLAAEGLVAVAPLPLPDAAEDGTARLQAGGRAYLLAPARRVAPGGRPGLLLVLPAANTTLRTEYDRYELDALRDHGLAVAVVGTHAASWNAGACCGGAQRDGVDDVAAVTAVRDDGLRRTRGDAAQVAALGHSVGALMAWRLACTPGFGAAAVVAVSGTLVSDCGPLSDTPSFLGLNGAADTTIPFRGARRPVPILGFAPPSVPSSLERLATAGGCDPAATTTSGAVALVRHEDCTGGGTVALQVVAGTGHPWAGLDATRRAAAFLSEHLPGVR
jgi:polyhydroxybutyrate depolymerase